MPLQHISTYRPILAPFHGTTERFGPSSSLVRSLRDATGRHLETLRLDLVSVDRTFLIRDPRNRLGQIGWVNDELANPLRLIGALGTLGVHADGLGELYNLPKREADRIKNSVKRRIDRGAASVMGLGLWSLFKNIPNAAIIVSASEGVRIKPGETGNNPAIYEGEIFARPETADRGRMALEHDSDIRKIYMVTDVVDGTGKAASFLPSSVTAMLVTRPEIQPVENSGNLMVRPIPEAYLNKGVFGYGLPASVTVDASSDDFLRALADAAGVKPEQLNLFSLKRPRHDRPIQEISDLGATFILDDDGDIMPGLAAGIRTAIYPNGQPLHGIFRNIGGAAEAGLMLPLAWLTGTRGTVQLRFASMDALKNKKWEDRYSLSDDEITTLRDAEWAHPDQPFDISAVVAQPFADGVAIFGGITDDYWIPELRGAVLGEDYAKAYALSIDPTGVTFVDEYKFAFHRNATKGVVTGRLRPLTSHLRDNKTNDDIENELKEWLATEEGKRQLRIEFRQEYYAVIDVVNGLTRIDRDAFESAKGQGSFDEKDVAIIHGLKKLRPDWFDQ